MIPTLTADLASVESRSGTPPCCLFSVTTKAKQICGNIRSTLTYLCQWQLVSPMSQSSCQQLSAWLLSSFLSDTDPLVFVLSFTVTVFLSILLPFGTLSASLPHLSLCPISLFAIVIVSYFHNVNFSNAFGILALLNVIIESKYQPIIPHCVNIYWRLNWEVFINL